MATLERLKVRLKVCLAIDQGLSPDSAVRREVSAFVRRFDGVADFALYLGREQGNARIVDLHRRIPWRCFDALATELPMRAQGAGNLVQNLSRPGRRVSASLEGRRVLVRADDRVPERSTVTANGVLDQLRHTGGVLDVSDARRTGPVPLSSHRRWAASRPPRKSNGIARSTTARASRAACDSPVLRADSLSAALDRVRADLLNQYVRDLRDPRRHEVRWARQHRLPRAAASRLRGPSQLPKI